jgi:hypothetical protein
MQLILHDVSKDGLVQRSMDTCARIRSVFNKKGNLKTLQDVCKALKARILPPQPRSHECENDSDSDPIAIVEEICKKFQRNVFPFFEMIFQTRICWNLQSATLVVKFLGNTMKTTTQLINGGAVASVWANSAPIVRMHFSVMNQVCVMNVMILMQPSCMQSRAEREVKSVMKCHSLSPY